MGTEGNEETRAEPEVLKRSSEAMQLAQAAVGGVAAGVATGVTAQAMSHLPKRKPKEPPSKIELPPGTKRD
jgi:hypothetical protein